MDQDLSLGDHSAQSEPLPRYMEQAVEFAESSVEHQRMELAVGLFESGVSVIPNLTWEDTSANVYAASTCLTVAARHLRAGSLLAFMGYYAETHVHIRAAYEFAGSAPVLAKEHGLAEEWVQKQRWFPKQRVHAWIRSVGGAPTET